MLEERPRQDLARDTLQIATFGEEDKDAILIGVRYLPITKLILITIGSERENAHIFAGQLAAILKIATEVHVIEKPLLYNTIMRFRKIIEENKGRFDEIIVNASSGDKQLVCATITASFINGLKTIAIDGNHPVLLPIIRLSYNEMISEAKMNILKALETAGGSVRDLTELSRLTGYGKPLLSYHINGSEDSKGLLQLGLVHVEKQRRDRLSISITELGKMLLAGLSS